ncbi:MAG: putative repeat protein (TIGR01451 family) [Candidatus Saccharimonadales bacterium]|jgi:uncharacterized repeat protein (TIGR01451 family)
MKLFNKLPKKMLAFGAAFVATAALSAVAVAGFGPDRTTRVWTPQENGFPHVTFNSYTDVPNGIGDERDFFRGLVSGDSSTFADPVSNVASDDVVTAHIYIHNGADPLLNDAEGTPGVAEDVTVAVDLPEGLSADHELRSTIQSDEATPELIYDTLDIDSINDTVFSLDYVPGSVTLHMQDGTTQALDDSIFTEAGVNIGDQNGCFEFVREITFDLEIEKPGYEIEKQARIQGEGSDAWRESVTASPGDVIEWRIDFKNTGEVDLKDVVVVDDLPSYINVTAPVKLYNANNRPPAGFEYSENAVQGDLVNIDIDSYTPTSNAIIVIETTIREDLELIQCGTHRIINVAYVTPAGLPTLNDNAQVIIENEPCVVEKHPAVCEAISASVLSNNRVRVTDVQYTANDATINDVTLNYGDGSEETVALSALPLTHVYANPGEYTVRATLNTTFDGQAQAVTSKDCTAHIEIKEKPVVKKQCTGLDVLRMDRVTYEVTANASVENTVVENYVFTVTNDQNVVVDTEQFDTSGLSATYNFFQVNEGTYTVEVVVTTANGVAEGECMTEITVEKEPETPEYTCDEFELSMNDRTASVSFVPRGINGATFKDAEVVFTADGSTQKKIVTNQITDGKVQVSYTFGEDAENVKAVASVRFNVTENDSVVVKEVTCKGKAVLSQVIEKCDIPGFEHLEKDSDKCEEPELPNTGAGSIVGLMTSLTAFGAVAHRRITLKNQ